MRLLPAIIIGLCIVIASVIGVFGTMFLAAGQTAGAVDRELRIEFEEVRFQIDGMTARIDALEGEVAALRAAATAPPATAQAAPVQIPQGEDNRIIDVYAHNVNVAARKSLNSQWTTPTPGFLVGLLGQPTNALVPTDGCLAVDNPEFAARLVEADVGPIRVRMLKAAAESLAEVFEQIRTTDPDLYDRISHSGTICVRPIRGTTDRWSSHSFGTAIDLNISGALDNFGDGSTQLGLTIIADFFEEAGWIWGAGFREREDSMHFEVSKEKLEEWKAEGRL